MEKIPQNMRSERGRERHGMEKVERSQQARRMNGDQQQQTLDFGLMFSFLTPFRVRKLSGRTESLSPRISANVWKLKSFNESKEQRFS